MFLHIILADTELVFLSSAQICLSSSVGSYRMVKAAIFIKRPEVVDIGKFQKSNVKTVGGWTNI